MSVRKVAEELDFLQKKVASVREIYKLYPDTMIRNVYGEDFYFSPSINGDVDIVRFTFELNWFKASTSKLIGNILVYSVPDTFRILSYHPNDMFKQLVIQNYQESMIKHKIPEKLIRECDLELIRFTKRYNIDLKNTDVKFIDSGSTLGKLLPLL